ncbi:hypothetical protein [Catellatospora chokoriensis]|uniref:Uncharacterized protein n=1 Tax=Catellatospora chokoriensis TaxID=310353 RepID=A0A8J3JZY9_9ACTN|nr:hypothetical protein [Catellatospora chokoriensis]GIF90376.1 hypothetical protein Cch02nite_38200 [Catellatospora chokoriensis]
MGNMTSSPRTLRGAIFAIDMAMPLPRIVIFQYNPESVTRSLTPRSAPTGASAAGPADAHRIWGAPVESCSMVVEVDAADQLSDVHAGVVGVSAQLAALELLLYPNVIQVVANTALLAAGTIEILPPQSPLTVLVFGPGRVVPVRVDGLSITEEAFDPLLNPIRARVELKVTTLTYNDLPPSDAGYALFLVHQVVKEALAVTGSAVAVGSASFELAGV